MHRDLFLVAPFFSSMIQGDPLYSPSSCRFGAAWPGAGWRAAPAALQKQTEEPSLDGCRPQPHGHSICAFSALTSHALFAWHLPSNSPVLIRKSLEEEGNSFNFKSQGKTGGLTLSCRDFRNIENVRSFIMQYIVLKQLVEKILFSITF